MAYYKLKEIFAYESASNSNKQINKCLKILPTRDLWLRKEGNWLFSMFLLTVSVMENWSYFPVKLIA